MRYLFIVYILVTCGCKSSIEEKNYFLAKIKEFDNKYSNVLIRITDTLLKIRELDTSYIIEYRPRSDKIYFSHIDSLEKTTDYFDINFNFSKKERDFFNDTKTGQIYFLKQYYCFYLKPFLFKKGNKTISIIILKNSKTENLLDLEARQIYKNKNLLYYVEDAW